MTSTCSVEMSWILRHESSFGRGYYDTQFSIRKPAASIGRCRVTVDRRAFSYAPFGRHRGLPDNIIAEGPGRICPVNMQGTTID